MRILLSHPSHGTRNFVSTANRIVIGRQKPGLDLDLMPDLMVSQQHARLTHEDGDWWIEDLGSTNGTLVNGTRIPVKTRLSPADRVAIGDTELKIVPDGEDNAIQGMRSTTLAADAPTTPVPELQSAQPPPFPTDIARQRLSIFYEVGAAFTSTDAIDQLLGKIVEQLLRAVPAAQGGGLLLREQGQLLLKAHIPEGHPSASLTLASQAIEKKQAFIWKRTKSLEEVSQSVIRAETSSAMYAPLLVKDEALGVVYVDSTRKDAFNDDDLYLLMALSYQAAMVVKYQSVQKALAEEAAIRADMLRWFSPKIAKRVTARGNVWSGGERVQGTILCSDIRGFTALTMNMAPNHVVKALNEMFEVLIPIIFKYDGTVDKYVGDSILAVFGTPEADPNQWEHAVRAAIDMQSAMQDLKRAWHTQGREPFEIGIGIHTGEILHGIIGAQDRIEFTVIGDAVNRAARYCDGAGKGEVLISREVYERVFQIVEVTPKTIATKHPTTEGNLQGYLVRGLK